MPRYARMIIPEEKACYHVMSRTALDNFPFGDVEKDEFVKIIKKFSLIYFVEMLGYSILGNHFHILVRMHPDSNYSDKEIKRRFVLIYGEEAVFEEKLIPHFRKKWSNLSKFMQEIKQTFSRYYNKRKKRRGTLWGERFKSVIVENGETLINCLAYIDLNPVRAGIVERPDDYRWSSLGYHVQTDNADNFLSLDFGLEEFGKMRVEERLRRYRRYVYESGAINHPGKKQAKVIDEKVIKKERKKNFSISRVDRFRNKTRYFTDSGIIGTKDFVYQNYQRFKDRFQSKNEKIPKPVTGLEGIFSMKRLSESL